LNAVNKLDWKENTNKLIFHILDAPPHGKEFEYKYDDYKEGCPCGLDYKLILK
jgi:hypothetical protein